MEKFIVFIGRGAEYFFFFSVGSACYGFVNKALMYGCGIIFIVYTKNFGAWVISGENVS